MSEQEFRKLVANAAPFDSEEQADRVARAALSRLGKNLSEGEAFDLAEHLPQPYASAVHEVDDRHRSPESLGDYVDAVADEVGHLEEPEATLRGVFAAVAEYVGEDELANARAQLPSEYGAIVAGGEVPVEETFLDAVRAETSLGGEERDAAQATLEVLGERLTRGEAEDVAAFLHGRATQWLVDYEDPAAGDFGPDEFVERVAARTDVPESTAETYVEEVSGTLERVVPDDELDRATAQIPDEYGKILTFVD
ncbi:DUF2267 domain-containing protein [Haloparvum sp. PAK95]|uniref:DUF2267 domain-containing protein n=1 Tax=Haloparvum sp. PAK95 TaxID=3418962 RepID=UPI003D2F3A8D